ncbi:MAG: tetratricopeptide repeat protein, partial [Gemmatimonadota bacterium]
MSDLPMALRRLARNLALAASLLAIALVPLAQVEVLAFLEPVVVWAVLAAGGCWALYLGARTMAGGRRAARPIVSSEGPGEELVQKATVAGYQAQEEYERGSKAEIAFLRGEQSLAAFRYAEAAGHYQAAADAVATLPAYLNLAAALMNCSEFAQAEEVLKVGLGLAERQHRRDFQGAFWAGLGIVLTRLGRLDLAWDACDRAISLFRSVGDGRGQADVALTMGNIHAHRGAFDEADKAFRRALKRYEVGHSDLGRANALGNLGNNCMNRDQPDKALKLHRQA